MNLHSDRSLRAALTDFIHNRHRDLLAAALCVLAGVTISALPHLIQWWRSGSAVWIADYDDLEVYLVIASHAYHRHPAYLTDPLCAGRASYLPWLLIVPGVLLTRVLTLPPIYIGLIWRLMAGAEMGLVWYLVFRLYFRRRWLAVFLALFALFDAGTLDGRPVVRHLADFVRLFIASPAILLSHELLPRMSGPWRIMTPGLSWPFLFLAISLIGRAVRSPSRSASIWAGIGFGLCFSYFYYWTAVGSGLLLAIVLDRPRRRTYSLTGCVGVVVGVPFLLGGLSLSRAGNADWLPRVDCFLPIGHFSELMFPKIAIVAAMLLFLRIWKHEHDLLYLWCIAVSALLLTDQQVITGVQFENWHWHYVWGPVLWLLIVLVVARVVESRPGWSKALAPPAVGILLVVIAIGFWSRGVEATRSAESELINLDWRQFAPEFERDRSLLQPGRVVAGTPELVSLMVIMNGEVPLSGYAVRLSSCVDNREWNQRIAADAFFSGLTRDEFLRQQEQIMDGERWGAWARKRELGDALIAERLSDFDAIAKDPDATARDFGLAYIVLPATAERQNLSSNWELLIEGPSWKLWERTH